MHAAGGWSQDKEELDVGQSVGGERTKSANREIGDPGGGHKAATGGGGKRKQRRKRWIPACAGMTDKSANREIGDPGGSQSRHRWWR
ncbi:MAG: hypothetical protein D8M59_03950 [Planctomycetes bacterium]|nr:hypothetical protein [Planctomycetota bacterium]